MGNIRRETREFSVTIGLHQGLRFKPLFLFTDMDELTTLIQEEVPWCILFADDIVLVYEPRDGVTLKLEKQ